MIQLLVVSVLSSLTLLPRAKADFSQADKAFLLQECQIFEDDLGTIPKLPKAMQAQLSASVAARDSAAFSSFKNTRNYYKFISKITNPAEALPFSRPLSGWNEAYLLPDELARYQKIVAEHPPCKEVWPDPPKDQLSPAQKEMLANQGGVLPADVEVIMQLNEKVQAKFVRWLANNDFKKLVPFKNSRIYYRKLLEKPGLVPLPLPGWNGDYLTPEEFCNYTNILDNAPW